MQAPRLKNRAYTSEETRKIYSLEVEACESIKLVWLSQHNDRAVYLCNSVELREYEIIPNFIATGRKRTLRQPLNQAKITIDG